ncbi:MAG: universal stress protein, partial [bacterium]
IEKELESNTQKQISAIAEQLTSEGFKVVTKVVKGRASDEICNYAKNESISIIAIGTHGRSGLEHFLFGSTTERVLRKAPCPVLSVRIEAA